MTLWHEVAQRYLSDPSPKPNQVTRGVKHIVRSDVLCMRTNPNPIPSPNPLNPANPNPYPYPYPYCMCCAGPNPNPNP